MATNYYLVHKSKPDKPVKFCLISAGWQPLWYDNPLVKNYDELRDLVQLNPNYLIIDEYQHRWYWSNFNKQIRYFIKNGKEREGPNHVIKAIKVE